jgi:hypothetical protein
MSYVISMHRLGDLRQTAITDLSKAIPCLVAPSFERSTLVVPAKLHNHLAIAAVSFDKSRSSSSPDAAYLL